MHPFSYVFFALTLLSPRQGETAALALAGTIWRLEAFADSLHDKSVYAAGCRLRLTLPDSSGSDRAGDAGRVHVQWERGSVEGFGGCNRFRGSFTIRGSSLSFGKLVTTMMDCPAMDVEYRLFGTLHRTTGFRITDGRLQLLEDDRLLARFCSDADGTEEDNP